MLSLITNPPVIGFQYCQKIDVLDFLPGNLFFNDIPALGEKVQNDFHEVPSVNVGKAQLIGYSVQELISSIRVQGDGQALEIFD